MAQLLIGPVLQLQAQSVLGTNLTVSSTSVFDGAVQLNAGGSIASGQTLTNGGTISGGAVNPSTLSTSGNASIGGTLSTTGNASVGGTLTTTGNVTIGGVLAGVNGATTQGAYGAGLVVGAVDELELTTTSATTILSVTAPKAGAYILEIYLRVVTAATTVTVSYSWTDASGSHTATPVNAVSEAVGPVQIGPFPIEATAGSTISISVTAGTANQVYASARIVAA
jgi:hypothetical protein